MAHFAENFARLPTRFGWRTGFVFWGTLSKKIFRNISPSPTFLFDPRSLKAWVAPLSKRWRRGFPSSQHRWVAFRIFCSIGLPDFSASRTILEALRKRWNFFLRQNFFVK